MGDDTAGGAGQRPSSPDQIHSPEELKVGHWYQVCEFSGGLWEAFELLELPFSREGSWQIWGRTNRGIKLIFPLTKLGIVAYDDGSWNSIFYLRHYPDCKTCAEENHHHNIMMARAHRFDYVCLSALLMMLTFFGLAGGAVVVALALTAL